MTVYLVIVYYRNGFAPDIDAFECRDKALVKLKEATAVYGQLEGVSVVLQENTIN
jgi:hypothetical protein